MRLSKQLHALLSQLGQPGAIPQPSELSKLLAQLVVLLEALPEGKNPLQALKTPGAWEDVPLQADNLDTPIYVRLPLKIRFTNVSDSALQPQLVAEPDGRHNSKITVLPLLKN